MVAQSIHQMETTINSLKKVNEKLNQDVNLLSSLKIYKIHVLYHKFLDLFWNSPKILFQCIYGIVFSVLFFLTSLFIFLMAEFTRLFMARVRHLSIPSKKLKLDGVSIVIPTWNKADMIYDNLLETDRVLQIDKNLAKNVEIIVINNGSPDNTEEKLEVLKPKMKTKFTVINSKENLGFARGINLGATLAQYNYLYFFNDDMIPKPGFMKHLVNYANHLLEHKINFFGIASQIFFYDPTKRREESGKTYVRSHLGGFLKVAHCVQSPLLESPSLTAYPGGGSSLINKSAFLQLGGYDFNSYRPMYAEDLDLGLMAWKKGLPSFYCPTSQIIHHHRSSSKRSNIDPSIWMFTNWLVVRLKLCDGWELFKTIFSFSFLSLVSARHATYGKTVLRVLPAILNSKKQLNSFRTIYKDTELLDFIMFEKNNRSRFAAAYEEK